MRQNSCTNTSQQNDFAKREHCHVVKTTISFLLLAQFYSVFWREAIITTTYLINMVHASHNLGFSPFYEIIWRCARLFLVASFWSTYFVIVLYVERTKLCPKSGFCVFWIMVLV